LAAGRALRPGASLLGQRPLFVVGASLGPAPPGELKTFAHQRLQQTATLAGIQVQSGQPIEMDGLQGYALEAAAQDQTSQAPMAVYQVLLLKGGQGGYYLMQGLVGARQATHWIRVFRQAAATFRRTRPESH